MPNNYSSVAEIPDHSAEAETTFEAIKKAVPAAWGGDIDVHHELGQGNVTWTVNLCRSGMDDLWTVGPTLEFALAEFLKRVIDESGEGRASVDLSSTERQDLWAATAPFTYRLPSMDICFIRIRLFEYPYEPLHLSTKSAALLVAALEFAITHGADLVTARRMRELSGKIWEAARVTDAMTRHIENVAPLSSYGAS